MLQQRQFGLTVVDYSPTPSLAWQLCLQRPQVNDIVVIASSVNKPISDLYSKIRNFQKFSFDFSSVIRELFAGCSNNKNFIAQRVDGGVINRNSLYLPCDWTQAQLFSNFDSAHYKWLLTNILYNEIKLSTSISLKFLLRVPNRL